MTRPSQRPFKPRSGAKPGRFGGGGAECSGKSSEASPGMKREPSLMEESYMAPFNAISDSFVKSNCCLAAEDPRRAPFGVHQS